MKKYRKNSTVVEAIQYDGKRESVAEILELLKDEPVELKNTDGNGRKFSLVGTRTGRTGTFTIYKDEWIMRDKGLFFVISNNIFQEMFVEVQE